MKKQKQPYNPAPLDVTSVELPPALHEVSELIARNVHEVWASERLREGWTYGSERNDSLKTHPCLVPYDELPEEEKNYDRNTAMNTIKVLKLLGFSIRKEEKEP